MGKDVFVLDDDFEIVEKGRSRPTSDKADNQNVNLNVDFTSVLKSLDSIQDDTWNIRQMMEEQQKESLALIEKQNKLLQEQLDITKTQAEEDKKTRNIAAAETKKVEKPKPPKKEEPREQLFKGYEKKDGGVLSNLFGKGVSSIFSGTGPIGAAISGFLIKYIGGLLKVIAPGAVFSKVSNFAVTAIGNSLMKVFSFIGSGIAKILPETIGKVMGTLFAGVTQKLTSWGIKGLLGVIPIFGWLLDIGSILSLFWDKIRDTLLKWAGDNPILKYIVKWADSFITPLSDFFDNITNAFVGAFQGDSDKIKQSLSDASASIMTTLSGLFTPVLDVMKGLSDGIKQWAKGYLDAFRTGGIKALTAQFSKANVFSDIGRGITGRLSQTANKGLAYSTTDVDKRTVAANQNLYDYIMTKESASAGGYAAVSPKLESGGGTGFALGAFQFSTPKVQQELLSGLKSDARFSEDAFTGDKPVTRDFTKVEYDNFLNKISTANMDELLQNQKNRKMLALALRSDKGKQIQQTLFQKYYVEEGLKSASQIKIGNSDLATLAKSDPNKMKAVVGAYMNQTKSFNAAKGKEFQSYDDFSNFLIGRISPNIANPLKKAQVVSSLVSRRQEESQLFNLPTVDKSSANITTQQLPKAEKVKPVNNVASEIQKQTQVLNQIAMGTTSQQADFFLDIHNPDLVRRLRGQDGL